MSIDPISPKVVPFDSPQSGEFGAVFYIPIGLLNVEVERYRVD